MIWYIFPSCLSSGVVSDDSVITKNWEMLYFSAPIRLILIIEQFLLARFFYYTRLTLNKITPSNLIPEVNFILCTFIVLLSI